MTISAAKTDREGEVEIRITSGSVTTTVVEQVGHACSFHTQLGQLLDSVEE